jgi:hypothetical protein
VLVLRALDAAAVWKAQLRPEAFQQADAGGNGFLLRFGEAIPPSLEFVGEFNFP